jgi:predicted DNA-binding transcriptional regulator YafY
VKRTDRLYALVEELRAISPRCRSARDLASRFEVSARTIERDISALQQSGVPIYAEPGRRGGYAIDKTMSLPPLNFTPAEAVAIAVALSRADEQPFAAHARNALRKVVAAMPGREEERARELAARIGILFRRAAPPDPLMPPDRPGSAAGAIEEALVDRTVLHIEYGDGQGVVTSREVEPGLFLSGVGGVWYLVGWCRLRDRVRVFRLDRILAAWPTGERSPGRPSALFTADLPDSFVLAPALD